MEVAAIRTLLADAFAQDPLMTWFFPETVTRGTARALWFGLFAEGYVRAGTYRLVHDEGRPVGVALWRAPGVTVTPGGGEGTLPQAGELFRLLSGAEHTARVQEAFGARPALLPDEPAVYLHMLAVAPPAQGRGIGARLVREVAQTADGVPVHLETTSPRALRFYEREGFTVTGSTVIGHGGPEMWGLRLVA